MEITEAVPSHARQACIDHYQDAMDLIGDSEHIPELRDDLIEAAEYYLDLIEAINEEFSV